MIRSAPRNGREATPHWKAARAGVLLLPFCKTTGRSAWPPTSADTLEWRECEGRGRIVAFSVVRRPVQPEWEDAVPYIVAMVELDVGVRMLSNVVDCVPETLRIGARVRVDFVETTDPELGLPVFRLE